MLDEAEHRSLLAQAARVRERILQIVWDAGSGHLGGALSQTDLLVALYRRFLRVDPARPEAPERDRFVLSKGHGGLGLAALLADLGFFPPSELAQFGRSFHRLGMHLDHGRVPGVEVSTGSLGHGLGVSVGIALGARMQGLPFRTVCMLSDGECYEGSTWEAAMAAPALGLPRLTVVIDRNRLTMDGDTERELPLEPLGEKWRAFGWNVVACDGHDLRAIDGALDAARAEERRPTVVVGATVKGRGVAFMEGEARWHYGGLDRAAFEAALASVRARLAEELSRG